MTGPNTGIGPTKKEAEAAKPSTEQAPAPGTKTGGGVDAIGRDATQVAKDLTRQGVSPAAATASGHAAAGSPESKAPDNPGGPGAEHAHADAVNPGKPPVGLQKEAAFFTASGSVEGNTIPSPTGLVPAGLIADDKLREQAIQQARAGAVDPHRGHSTGRFRISEDAVHRMSPAALRAVAQDRGYDGIEGGRRAVQAKFLAAQAKDDSLVDPPEGHHLASATGIPAEAVAATGTVSGPVTPTPAVGAATGAPATGAQTEAQAKGIASTHNTTDGKPVGGAK